MDTAHEERTVVIPKRDEGNETWRASFPTMEVRQTWQGWTIRYQFAATGRNLRVVGLTVAPSTPGTPYRGLSAGVLRRASVTRALETMRRGLGTIAASSTTGIEGWARIAEALTGTPGWLEAWQTEIRPQFASATERQSVAAAVYVAALGDRRPPIQAVTEFLKIERAQATELIRSARRNGLLTATGRGRADGQLAGEAAAMAAAWIGRKKG